MAGAPKGNQNATKGAEWRQAIKRALTRLAEAENPDEEITYRRGLDILAAKFVEVVDVLGMESMKVWVLRKTPPLPGVLRKEWRQTVGGGRDDQDRQHKND